MTFDTAAKKTKEQQAAAKKTKEQAAFSLVRPVRLSTQVNFRRMNAAGPGLSIGGEYSTVDLDTMHQLYNQTMPTVLLHLAGHCEHKITCPLNFFYPIDNFQKKN